MIIYMYQRTGVGKPCVTIAEDDESFIDHHLQFCGKGMKVWVINTKANEILRSFQLVRNYAVKEL